MIRSPDACSQPVRYPLHAKAYARADLARILGEHITRQIVEGLKMIRDWAESEGPSDPGEDPQSGHYAPDPVRFRQDGGQSWLAKGPQLSMHLDGGGSNILRHLSNSGLIRNVTLDSDQGYYHFTAAGRRTFFRLMYPDLHEGQTRAAKRAKQAQELSPQVAAQPRRPRVRA